MRVQCADAEAAAAGDCFARYLQCFECGAPTSEFVPARPEDAPTGVTLTPCVLEQRRSVDP